MERSKIAPILIGLVVLIVVGFVIFNRPAEAPGPDNSGSTNANNVEQSLTYVELVDWPPQLRTLNEAYSCTEAGTATARAGRTDERTIGGREFCVTEVVEAAAGSRYTQYAYVTKAGTGTQIATFTTRMPQCANYDSPQKEDCEREQLSFSADDRVRGVAFSPTGEQVELEQREQPPIYACTMEAKICPDGSSVGRSGPKCEFAKCPGE